MKTPWFAPSIKNLKSPLVAKKMAAVNAFFAKHPNKDAETIKDDGPARGSKSKKS